MCIPIITGKVDMAEKELEIMGKRLNETVESKKELKLAKINEAYHRKKMEYYKEEIKILENKGWLAYQ